MPEELILFPPFGIRHPSFHIPHSGFGTTAPLAAALPFSNL